MTPEQLADIRWLRSMPGSLDFAAARIDAENGVIYDVVMVQEGEAKGHGIHLEAEFVQDLVAFDKRVFGERGVKARLGHPGASDNTMGTQLAYFRNVRERKKSGKMQAIGDLHLLNSADLSPEKPNMREWVLGMATEAPDWIMSSIVFRPGRYYQRKAKKDGAGKKYIWEYVMVRDEDGNDQPVWQSSDPKLGNVFVEFGEKGEHFFTDLVEDGAATENMFSNQASGHLLVSQASQFLADHPELKQFAEQHPDKVQAFLVELGIKSNPKKSLKMTLKEILFGKDNAADDVALSAAEIQELREKVSLAATAVADANASLATAQANVTALQATLTTKEGELAAAQTRIAELEKKPAAAHTTGATESDAAADDTKSWERDSINVRARNMKFKKTA